MTQGGSPRSILLATLPLAFAIGVFGTIFGAAARPLIGAGLTLAASGLIFSGVVQFATVGLLLAGSQPAALLVTAIALNLRNLLLGAVLRPRIGAPPLARAGLAWFLIDETVGLALATEGRASLILAVSGLICYLAWLMGTTLGLLGASLVGLRDLADAIFPVLFIGLAALSARRRDLAVRAVAAFFLTIVLAALWPSGRGLIPVLAALLVALP
ncbi:MAG: AzlC family ABC transporter permease [Armatimonadetes bacterium]|nr:AzlC family ABC transporter permease [Armatimonadota bacterium]